MREVTASDMLVFLVVAVTIYIVVKVVIGILSQPDDTYERWP